MKQDIIITEVGPRDGLQNEKAPLSREQKSELINRLLASGIDQIEIGSFVNPKAVPAMADTDSLVHGTNSKASALKIGLIMNDRGLDRALEAKVDGVCIVTVVSETLCLKNNNRSAQQALDMALHLSKRAKENKLWTRIDVAPAWVCPYEGATSQEQLIRTIDPLWELAPDELALCDTIGHANPYAVSKTFETLGERYDRSRLAAHFHDTKSLGLANATAALLQGIRRFDASIGGLGGCPFAPGAKGNLATEDLVHLCHSMGFKTGIDESQLWSTVDFMEKSVGRPLGGHSRTWFQTQKAKQDKIQKEL